MPLEDLLIILRLPDVSDIDEEYIALKKILIKIGALNIFTSIERVIKKENNTNNNESSKNEKERQLPPLIQIGCCINENAIRLTRPFQLAPVTREFLTSISSLPLSLCASRIGQIQLEICFEYLRRRHPTKRRMPNESGVKSMAGVPN